MNFVLVTPKQTSGGPIAIHALCKYLNECGQNAKVFHIPLPLDDDGNYVFNWRTWFFYTVINMFRRLLIAIFGEKPFLNKRSFRGQVNLSVRDCPIKHTPFISKDTIVIYPEVILGNPLHADRVVRWLLYFYRFKEDSNAYSSDDLFVCYRKVFNDKDLNPKEHQLHVNYFNLDLYKKTNDGPRQGKCYIVRKGEDREDLPERFDGPIIDKLSEEEKVKILNESEVCISYDTQTAYSSIAALCGCLSVVVPEGAKRRSDYVTSEDHYPGIAYGFSDEEIAFAHETADEVFEDFLASNQLSRAQTEAFIELCEEFFNKKPDHDDRTGKPAQFVRSNSM